MTTLSWQHLLATN